MDDFLKVSKIRFDGQQNVFLANKETLALYFDEHKGRIDMELTTDVLYIIRGNDPVMLELIGDMQHYEGIWGSFEDYRYDRLEKLFRLPQDELVYLIVLDGGCESREMDNILVWYTFRERDKFGQGFLVSKEKEGERYDNLTSKWKLNLECEAIFVKRVNSITIDKFKPEYEFIGKFTLDDYSRKITGKFAKPYLMSQSYNEIKGEEDYRLVGSNLDSTWQELNSDSAILFYNRTQTDFDDLFKSLRDLAQGACNGDDCGEYSVLVEKLRNHKLQMFSLNITSNDLPSFVIEHAPTILIFKAGQEDPVEIKLKGHQDMVRELSGYLIKNSKHEESEL